MQLNGSGKIIHTNNFFQVKFHFSNFNELSQGGETMKKVAIFVLADVETNEDLGRVVNALEAVKQFKEAKDEVKLYFDGAGTHWISTLSNKDHIANGLFESVKDKIEGACLFCAQAFGSKDAVQECKIDLVAEKDQHIDVQNLISNGFQIMNF